MSRALADSLQKLHRAGNDSVRASAFTPSQQKALDAFARETSAVKREVRGAGTVYVVLRQKSIALALEKLRPGLFHPVDPAAPGRAQNLGMHRDTKAGRHGHRQGYLLMKAIGDPCRWTGAGGGLDVTALTRQTGVVGLEISATNDWVTDAPIWLVENQLLFAETQWLPPGACGTLLCFFGTLSGVALEWLAERPRAPEIHFFADYDGAGLFNFAKVLEASVAPVSFWLMPGWRKLLGRYGNAGVWAKTRHQAEAAAARLADQPLPAEVREMMDALWLQGLALEHEAALLGAGTPET